MGFSLIAVCSFIFGNISIKTHFFLAFLVIMLFSDSYLFMQVAEGVDGSHGMYTLII